MRSSTETLIAAMRILSGGIHGGDGVAGAAVAEAADRLVELQARVAELERQAAIGLRAVAVLGNIERPYSQLAGTRYCPCCWSSKECRESCELAAVLRDANW